MKIFYFTGTGNSLSIAKTFDAELYSIPQILRKGPMSFSDQTIGLIFPTYGMNVPSNVMEFIKKISLQADYIFAIMTCAHDNCDASSYFVQQAAAHGISVDYSNAISMVGNHIPVTDIEDELRTDKNIPAQLRAIHLDIAARKTYVKSGSPLVRHVAGIKNSIRPDNCLKFTVSETCIGCGTCSRVCPAHNITLVNKHVSFGGHCIGCQSCVHNCPQKSILVAGDKKPHIRYRHPEISLAEIMQAND